MKVWVEVVSLNEEKTRNGMYSVNGILPHIPSSGIFRVVDPRRH